MATHSLISQVIDTTQVQPQSRTPPLASAASALNSRPQMQPLSGPKPHAASPQPLSGPRPHSASPQLGPKPHPAFRSQTSVERAERARVSPPPPLLECRLMEVETPTWARRQAIRLTTHATSATLGKPDFHDDDCIAQEHFSVRFNPHKWSLLVEPLTTTPAFWFKAGSQEAQPLAQRKVVELKDGDRFSAFHHCHLLQVEIGELGSQPALLDPDDDDQVGLLSRADDVV
eukprot:NODE_1411_length_967_cov_172.389978_g1089_i0.p1 GENE.NODE_1411_length_967_cov_172.389978_g1089_i0~~NODE_1411_length_967_cov_172.389978_g1089_i0.p1  ORF type:complete len:249 (-),score=29.15 NODE_1411_length_967_cov_172.389978_g1089_i0:220-909(-)